MPEQSIRIFIIDDVNWDDDANAFNIECATATTYNTTLTDWSCCSEVRNIKRPLSLCDLSIPDDDGWLWIKRPFSVRPTFSSSLWIEREPAGNEPVGKRLLHKKTPPSSRCRPYHLPKKTWLNNTVTKNIYVLCMIPPYLYSYCCSNKNVTSSSVTPETATHHTDGRRQPPADDDRCDVLDDKRSRITV